MLDKDKLKLFLSLVTERLEKGDRVYGDKSFSRKPSELLKEIEEEMLDTVGWMYPLWDRLQGLKLVVQELEAYEQSLYGEDW